VALRAPWRAVPAAARPQTRDPRAYWRLRSRLIPIPRARPLGSARGPETHAPPPPPSHHPPSPILGAAGTPASGGRLGGPRTSTRRPRSSPTVTRTVPAPRALAAPPHPHFAALRPRQAPPHPKRPRHPPHPPHSRTPRSRIEGANTEPRPANPAHTPPRGPRGELPAARAGPRAYGGSTWRRRRWRRGGGAQRI